MITKNVSNNLKQENNILENINEELMIEIDI